jgi:hypothetical protein
MIAQDQDACFKGSFDRLDGTRLKGRVGEFERGGSGHEEEERCFRVEEKP